MYDQTITLFNYRESDHTWRTSVFDGVNIIEAQGKSATKHGDTGSDSVEILLNCQPFKLAMDRDGNELLYLTPKAYAARGEAEGYFTLTPECDFIMTGDHHSEEPLNDDDYDEGLYHAMNDEYDGVYMITSATWFGLLPHFEIGGR